MSLIPLSGLLKTASAGFSGYGEDKETAIKNELAKVQQQRQANLDAITIALGKKNLGKIEPGEPGYGDYQAGNARKLIPVKAEEIGALAQPTADARALESRAQIPVKVDEQAALRPGKVGEAVDVAKGTEPVHVAGANAIHDHSVANPGTNFAIKEGVDPVTGQPTTKRFETHTGAISAAPEILPKVSKGLGPAVNKPQMDAARTNLEAAKKTMDEFEEKLRTGKATYNPFDATKGAVGSSEQAQTATGLLGPGESFVANTAGASLRSGNSDLAKYLKAKKFAAEAILNTHKRPNQTQYEIEQELSGIGPMWSGWDSPDAASQIAQSKDRRDRMWNEVFGGNATTAAPSAGGGRTIVVNGKTVTIPH
jgi:hypothetical protein